MPLPILVCCLPVSTCSLQTGGVPHFDKNGIWWVGGGDWMGNSLTQVSR